MDAGSGGDGRCGVSRPHKIKKSRWAGDQLVGARHSHPELKIERWRRRLCPRTETRKVGDLAADFPMACPRGFTFPFFSRRPEWPSPGRSRCRAESLPSTIIEARRRGFWCHGLAAYLRLVTRFQNSSEEETGKPRAGEKKMQILLARLASNRTWLKESRPNRRLFGEILTFPF